MAADGARGATLLVNAAVAVALYAPFGVGGKVFGTAVASAAMTVGQAWYLRRELGGNLEGCETADALVRIVVASVLLAAVAYGPHLVLDDIAGCSVIGQVVSVCGALGVRLDVYAVAVLTLRVPEEQQIRDAVRARLRRPRR